MRLRSGRLENVKSNLVALRFAPRFATGTIGVRSGDESRHVMLTARLRSIRLLAAPVARLMVKSLPNSPRSSCVKSMRMNGKSAGKLGPVAGNSIAQKRTLSGSLIVRLMGISFAPFGLPTNGAIWNRGAARLGSPVAVFSSHSRTLGNVAGNGGRPNWALNVNEGDLTLVIV